MKIFRKERLENGRRHIYFCGIRIFSYKKHKHNNCIPHINKKLLDIEIAKFKSNGINKTKRDKKIIISLTSFPQRMKDIHYAIFSLLKQTVKPDKIILWLGEDKFPNKEQDLPETLLNLKKFGLTIKWCKDIRSYTKLIPALKEYPDDIIITVDDDIYYPKYLVEKLYNAYLKDKNMIHCFRAHKIKFNPDKTISPYNDWKKSVQNVKPSFDNFLTGVGGVLYPPKCLYKDVLDEKLFMKLAPYADDVWFWAMAVKNKTKINIVNSENRLVCVNPQRELRLTNEATLAKINVAGDKNDEQIKNVVEYIGINL